MGRRKFVLIDHSLRDYEGHYYEYARNVLLAAEQAGFAPVLACNSALERQNVPWDIPDLTTYPLYRYDIRGSSRAPKASKQGEEYPGMGFRRGSPRCFSLLSKIAPTAKKAYTWFTYGQRLRAFADATQCLASRVSLQENDIVFVPTMGPLEIRCLEGLLRQRSSELVKPHWAIVLRRDLGEAGLEGMKSTLKVLVSADTDRRVRLFTDSDRLTEQYMSLDLGAIETLPIPVSPHLVPSAHCPTGPIPISYLGDARMEKGFNLLPDVVNTLAEYIRRKRIVFWVQANLAFNTPFGNESVISAKELLRNTQGVRLFERALSSEDYYQILRASGVGLLPYDKTCYATRSSGILAECLALGKPVVVPKNTWLSDQLGTGKVGESYEQPEEIGSSLRRVIDHYDVYYEHAVKFSAFWRDKHNPKALVQAVVASVD